MMDKNTKIAIAVGIVVVLVVIGGQGIIANLFSSTNNTNIMTQNSAAQQASDLRIEDVTVGTGTEAVAGTQVTVNYIGTLENGTEFDNSYKRGQPFTFTLGAGQVIPGWDQGVQGMKVGGKRILIIPPDLGYGSQAITDASGTVIIPASSTLVFQVELLNVK